MNLEDALLRDTRANQPAVVGEGILYFVTDEGVIEQFRGGVWVDYGGSGSGGFGSGILGINSPLAIPGDDGIDGLDGFPGLAGPQGIQGIQGIPGSGGGSSYIAAFIPPVLGDTAWENQGSATISSDINGLYLRDPTVSGTPDMRLRKMAAPATPYVVTAAFLYPIVFTPFNNFGLFWRNSGSGNLVIHNIQSHSGTSKPLHAVTQKWNSPNSYSADYLNSSVAPNGVVWLRIADNGTNRITSHSMDGIHWETFHTVSRTDFLTADEIGFFVGSQNGNAFGVLLLSWEIT